MKRLWILGLLVLIAACAPTTSVSPLSAPERPMNIAPIQIDQVEIRLAESFPVQVFAHVRGVIGDGCSSVLPVTQQRDGNTITLSINRQRPADAICTQIAKLYEENIRLEGDFPAGEYVLKVNDVTQPFTVK